MISNTFEKIKLIERETHLWFAHIYFRVQEIRTPDLLLALDCNFVLNLKSRLQFFLQHVQSGLQFFFIFITDPICNYIISQALFLFIYLCILKPFLKALVRIRIQQQESKRPQGYGLNDTSKSIHSSDNNLIVITLSR